MTSSVRSQSFKAVEVIFVFFIGKKPSRKHFAKNNTVINPSRACNNNSLCSDMALIFLRPEGSQMFRSAQFFMNIKRGRKSINHGVAYKGSSLSLVIENQHFNSAKPH